MRKSIITALILAVIGIGWIASGQFGTEERMQTASGDSASSPTAPASKALMRVRVADLEAVMRVERVDVTGRTEASRTVQIRAETHGQVRELLRQRGDNVEKGAPIARLRLDDRTAKLEEAKASLRQREIEFKAAESLQQKGFRSETDEAAALARLDGARAIVEQMQIDIARTTFRAPFDGMIDSGHIELGDYVQVGDVAATVVDLDPILVVGNVSERQVNSLHVGMPGTIRLIDGTERDGIIRFVAPVAEPSTRTYRVELEVPNADVSIRDGLTAVIEIPVSETDAHFVSPSTLTLNDDGVVGVKVVTPDNLVAFQPVEIIADEPDGVWLGGLPRNIRLITVGQEFVLDGERVEPVAGNARIVEADRT
ncbi:MAG: efflux RND transporter periplasmic adaptor subunit [Proteobacteria bacterium]|nr:efflux RND transporter periplasmic adaptor subunit [Pseudomonadota bacterium]